MKKIPCVMMRGGTSRGAFLLAEHLPEDQTQRDKILMAIMGSGNDLEIDGIGGGNPLTSKVAIISRSSDPRLPVFAMLANVSGAPLMLTALALLFSNSYGGMVTHYGGAAGPVIFGVGYNDIKSWWLVGAVLTILTFLVHITLGVWWWNMLIGWNML